jgi:colanic acid/amylovoran biosynthesis protein
MDKIAKKILITGGALSENKGAEAMTVATINIIKNAIKNAEITVASPIKRDIEIGADMDISIVTESKSKLSIVTNLLKSFFSRLPLLKFGNPYLDEYRNSDLIVDISGDVFSDVYKRGVLIVGWRYLVAIFLNKKFIIFPQTLGPYNKKFSKIVSKYIINRSSLTFTRERISYNYLNENFSLTEKSHKFAIDTAFFLPSEPLTDVYNDYFNESNKVVGLSVSQSIAKYSTQGNPEEKEIVLNNYVDIMKEFIEYLVNEKNYKVILVPHVTDTINNRHDDRIMQSMIINLLDTKINEKVFSITEDLPAIKLKSIIARCDYFVGSRMHASIASLSTSVPTIVIAYSKKYLGIMSHFGMEDFVFDVTTLSYDDLIDKFIKLTELNVQIKNKLNELNLKNRDEYYQLLLKSIQMHV